MSNRITTAKHPRRVVIKDRRDMRSQRSTDINAIKRVVTEID